MEGLHAGHRERLLLRYETDGFASFQPHEILEMLLFYAIPLRNVNPLAHRLLARFGSVEAILHAPVEQLIEVPGIGETAAEWLRELPGLIQYYEGLSLTERPILDRLAKTILYGERLFLETPGPELWLLNLTSAGHLLHSSLIERGFTKADERPLRPLLDAVLRYHGNSVIVLEKRDVDSLSPTRSDIAFTRSLNDNLTAIGVRLLDNVLLTKDGAKSFRGEGLLRFHDSAGALMEESSDLMLHWLD